MGSLRSSLACTLQKGNAMIVKQYLIRASQSDSDTYVAPSKKTQSRKRTLHVFTQSASAASQQNARRSMSITSENSCVSL